MLAGDGRLAERLRTDEFLPLASRMRVRLPIDRALPQDLQDCLRHALQQAGAASLMTPEVIATLCDHAQGNLRALMTMAGELLEVAAQRDARQIDETLFFETCGVPTASQTRAAIRRRRSASFRFSRPGASPIPRAAALAGRRALVGTGRRHRWRRAEVLESFLALDLAVAVAAGVPCLRRFAVSRPGRVLLYPAEDALHIVRRRLEGICAAAGASLAELDVQVITASSLRLDLDADCARLDETVARLKPRLLVLDPFVRLHRIDENVSGDVAPLLAFLRELQRRHAVAVAVVHHARKGAGAIRAGQALRGSSEFHAWAIPISISAATATIASS